MADGSLRSRGILLVGCLAQADGGAHAAGVVLGPGVLLSPDMQFYLLSFPLWLLFAVMVLGSALLTACASCLLGRYLPAKGRDNALGLAIFQTVGAIFGITLAFTISAVYTEFEAAQSNVSQESNVLGTLYRLAIELPAPQRDELQAGLHTYAQRVVDSEWPAMAHGDHSLLASAALDRLWQVQREFQPSTPPQQTLEVRLYEQVRALTEHRRNRLLDSRSQLAPLMWALLLGGGFVTVAFALLLRSGHARSQALMSATLAAVIGFGLLLVMALDCPFSGGMHVPPDAIADTLALMPRP